jgi:hypothetical protein
MVLGVAGSAIVVTITESLSSPDAATVQNKSATVTARQTGFFPRSIVISSVLIRSHHIIPLWLFGVGDTTGLGVGAGVVRTGGGGG